MKIIVLRLGHRPRRDKRITTHVALVARAFGADEMVMTVDDESVAESIADVVERWGGDFSIEVIHDWRRYIETWEGDVVHLTMYGVPIDDTISKVKTSFKSLEKDMLIVVGAEKVPGEVFKMADFNISVSNQPHSEVSALAIFLDRFFEGEELKRDFGGEMRIIPSEKFKRVAKD
ncbi:MAG: tRNA (cytidine(56)-2'-O)-methyltransferase [Candidatus Hydrothermarchaeales archaeon]